MTISDGAMNVLKEFVGEQATGSFADEVAAKYGLDKEGSEPKLAMITGFFVKAAEAAARGDDKAMEDMVRITHIPEDEARVIVGMGVPETQVEPAN